MSNKKTLDNITPTQIKAKGVVSLADRPNQSSSYGVGGLSATNLKLWFDKLATFLAEKINEIQNVLNGDGTGEDGVYGSDYIGIPQLGEGITCLTDLVNAIKSGELATLLMAYASESEEGLSDVQSIINGFAKQIADLEETVGLIYYGAYSTADTLKVGYTTSSSMTDLSMNEAVKAGYYFLLFWTDTSTDIDYLCACLATAVTDGTVTWQVVSYVRLTGKQGETGNGIKNIVLTSTSGLVDTYTITFTDGTATTYKVTNGEKGDTGETGATGATGEKGDTGATGAKGETGVGILSIAKTATKGLVDTYTITLTDGSTYDFTVTNADGGTSTVDFTEIKSQAGGTITLEMDPSTYVVTATLKAIDGTVISTDSIDLPLESVVVSGSYDSVNKNVVLSLQDGSTITFPVSDLIDGLATSSEVQAVADNLSAEITNRTNADSVLQDNIDAVASDLSAEVTARKETDSNLSLLTTNVTNEISDRKSADTDLQNSIDGLKSSIAEEYLSLDATTQSFTGSKTIKFPYNGEVSISTGYYYTVMTGSFFAAHYNDSEGNAQGFQIFPDTEDGGVCIILTVNDGDYTLYLPNTDGTLSVVEANPEETTEELSSIRINKKNYSLAPEAITTDEIDVLFTEEDTTGGGNSE